MEASARYKVRYPGGVGPGKMVDIAFHKCQNKGVFCASLSDCAKLALTKERGKKRRRILGLTAFTGGTSAVFDRSVSGRILRRYVLLPAYWKYVKHSQVLDHLRELRAQQWNSLEENRAIQARKLYELLKYASENIPYYKRVVQERGIKIREDCVFDDLRKFPFLTKKIIREHFDELYKFRNKTYYLNHSGGSTGEPVEFYQDREYASWSHAVTLLFNEWAFCPIGSRVVKLWGSERDVFQGSQGLRGKLSGLVHNVRLINAFNMSEQEMESFVRFLERWKPVMLLAYVEPLYEVAKLTIRKRWKVYPPRSIMTAAGTLFPDFREQIQAAFEAPVFDRYGSREVGGIACECDRHQGLHISLTTHFLEIVGADGERCRNGEVGEIVVTSLTNYTMPFIRYRIGDRAAMSDESCSCGRGMPMLKNIEGRSTSSFRNQRGDIIAPEYFIHLIGVLLNKKGIIEKFQVIQEDWDFIVVKLVVNSSDKYVLQPLLAEIEKKIQLVMGQKTRVEFALVDNIPPSPSGKYLYTISNVGNEY